MVVDKVLAMYVEMRIERESLGDEGSTVTGRMAAGECCGAGVPGSRVPIGVRYDGLDALGLYQQVDRAIDYLEEVNPVAAMSVVGREFHRGQPTRLVADKLGIPCTSYRRGVREGMQILHARLTA